MKTLNPEGLARNIERRGPAPVHLWDPPFCGDMDLLISKDGSWIHQGKPIRRAAMVELFASVLMLAKDGDYYLVTPVEKVRIQVEDCPFIAIALDIEGHGEGQRLKFTSNVGETVYAGPEHPIEVGKNSESGEPHPTVHVRSGLKALINRAVFYRLVEAAQEQENKAETLVGVISDGCFFELGRHQE